MAVVQPAHAITNIAGLATVTASSQNSADNQQASKAVDGVADGYPGDYTREWATAGQKTGAWLKLAWSSPYTVNQVVLHDRPNTDDQITGATLSFSDGSTVTVGALTNNGNGVTVNFPARTITNLTMTVTGVSSATQNIGLSEIEVYGVLGSGNQPPVATNACVATPANTPVTGAVSATDPEGQSLMYSLLTPASKGTVNLDISGNFAYTPNDPNLRGLDKFTYQVTDGLLSATGSVWVAIDGAIRVDPLGDSITAGYPGDGSTEAYWVGYRRKLLNDLSALYAATPFGINFVGSVTTGGSASPPLADLDNEGHPGWCDDNSPYCTVSSGENLADSVSGFLDANPADIILLHIGTNEFSTSSAGVNAILDNISTWAQAHYPVTVFVARIIPSLDGSLNVNSFNNNVAAIATDRPAVKVYLVDQQAALQQSTNLANPALMGDNLHPNQTGYDLMADTWKAQMLSTGVLPSCP